MNLPQPTIPVNEPTSPIENQIHTQPQPRNNVRGDFNYKDYYRWMVGQLTPRISSLAVALLGNPTFKRPTEWRWGRKHEVVVYIAGEKMGRFHDFESGATGDALELVKYKTGYRSKELSEWVKNYLGCQPKTFAKKEAWKPIIPIPEEALKGEILKGLSESFNRKGFVETGRYCYRDLEGNVLGYVVRFEDGEGKMTLPLTYCMNNSGTKYWRWKGLPIPRLPYGAELLRESTNTILIVEGEKKCDAARSLFPEMTVVSWVAGSCNVALTNWSCLANRNVVLWPDNDEPGLKCMAKLKNILEDIEVNSVRIVSLPADAPHGWDLADKFPEGWDKAYLQKLVIEAF